MQDGLYLFNLRPNRAAGQHKAHVPRSRSNWCKIAFVSSGPQLTSPQPRERNWVPLAVAASVMVTAGIIFFFAYSHGAGAPKATPVDAPLDPYAASLPITNLAMSRSSNFIGEEITYLDGHIANTGNRTVTAITAQVLFRDFTNIITQNTTQSMQLIRTRKPYIDVEPLSAAPLQPGQGRDFRLVFDGVSSEWNGEFPEIRLVRIETR